MRLSLLVVDPDPVSQVFLVGFASAEKLSASAAGTLESALRLLADDTLTHVLADCQLPDGTADQLVAARAGRVRPVVVAMSANLGTARCPRFNRQWALAHGFDDFLAKPVTRTSYWSVLARHGFGVMVPV